MNHCWEKALPDHINGCNLLKDVGEEWVAEVKEQVLKVSRETQELLPQTGDETENSIMKYVISLRANCKVLVKAYNESEFKQNLSVGYGVHRQVL
ncbi:hypothetical protein GEMRC1_001345 [Eukaryota sp. GEM-RC1]